MGIPSSSSLQRVPDTKETRLKKATMSSSKLGPNYNNGQPQKKMKVTDDSQTANLSAAVLKLAQNQLSPLSQNPQQSFVEQTQTTRCPHKRMQSQLPHAENLRVLHTDDSSKGKAIDDGLDPNTVEGTVTTKISFKNFPYYLSKTTIYQLIVSYFIYMKRVVEAKNRNPDPALRRVLLSGPEGSGIYQEMLAVALSHHFGVKLLVLDCRMNLIELSTFGQPSSNNALRFDLHPAFLKSQRSNIDMPSFSNAFKSSSVSELALHALYGKPWSPKIGDSIIYTGFNNNLGLDIASSWGPYFGSRGKVITLSGDVSNEVGVEFDIPFFQGNSLGGRCQAYHGFYCSRNEICADVSDHVQKPMLSAFEDLCDGIRLILFIEHAGDCMIEDPDVGSGLNNLVNLLPANVFVIGSHIRRECSELKENNFVRKEKEQRFLESSRMMLEMFKRLIQIEMPKDQNFLVDLKRQLDRDAKVLNARENISRLHHVLSKHGFGYEDLYSLHLTDYKLTNEDAEKVIELAVGHDLRAHSQSTSNFNRVFSRESIFYGLDKFRAIQSNDKIVGIFSKGIAADNKFESKILEEVIPPNEIGVKFDDIGALDSIKDKIKELVMLPLQMPDLFCDGQLRKPCSGMLLFGPPGTGKTMLARAVAAEAGANFLTISNSTISLERFGDSEKYVKAIFSVAIKIAPTVVFIDEVDDIFGGKKDLELAECLGKFKREFIINWDGLYKNCNERVLVLAATRRPFDLDEGIISRMPRRFMLDLPDLQERSKILKVILAKETLDSDVDIESIACITKGFSGRDLKNLCSTASRRPVEESRKKLEEAEEDMPVFRPVNMEDFKCASEQVRASVCKDSKPMSDLLNWQ